MKNLEINTVFKEHYLIAGNTYDNFIFENCHIDFIKEAEKSLRENSDKANTCLLVVSPEREKRLENIFSKCPNEFQKMIFARDYINFLVMLEYIRGDSQKEREYSQAINAIERGEYDRAKSYHVKAPLIHDISLAVKSKGIRAELDIFLVDNKSVVLQKAINNFLSARMPISIKVFSTNKLLSYFDQNGIMIECPHDFMAINVNNYIEYREETEKE